MTEKCRKYYITLFNDNNNNGYLKQSVETIEAQLNSYVLSAKGRKEAEAQYKKLTGYDYEYPNGNPTPVNDNINFSEKWLQE